MKLLDAIPRLLAALLVLFLAAAAAHAQSYPVKPVQIVINVASGVPDLISRMLGETMAKQLGQPFVVVGKVGAGGTLAAAYVKSQPPDGYTIWCADTGTWGVNPALQPGTYDPVKDFVPLGQVATNTLFLVADAKLGVRSVQEFIDKIKANPGKYNYGASQTGSLHHIFMASFLKSKDLDMVRVPYAKGAAESMQALLAGDIQAIVTGYLMAQPHVESGRLVRLLGSTQRRSGFDPVTPTLAEVGMRESFNGDIGYLAPAGTPKPVVDKLSAALAEAVKSPAYVEKMKGFAIEALYQGPQAHGELVRSDFEMFKRAAKSIGLTGN